MRELRLSDAQIEACDLSRHLAVTAGAGSGKTAVLTERYLRALETVRRRPAPLRRVVALTFTEKATTEMRSRVREGIRARLRSASRDGDRELVAFWRRVRDEFQSARISTIHGFCVSLLREHPLAADVDPGLDVVDAAETRLMIEEAIRSHLARTARLDAARDDQAGALRRVLRSYRPRELRQILAHLIENRDFAGQWHADALRPADERLAELRAELAARAGAAADRLRTHVASGDTDLLRSAARRPIDDNLAADCRALAPFIDALLRGNLDDDMVDPIRRVLLTGAGKARSFSRRGKQAAWGRDIARVRDALSALASAFETEVGGWIAFDPMLETLAAELERDLATLYDGTLRRYHALTRWGRRTDFVGLELLTRSLLERPGMRRRVRTEIDFLMVDEFQDTNRLQWAILEAIVGAGPGGDGGSTIGAGSGGGEAPPIGPTLGVDAVTPNLFIVGDAKQAIYEFRGGRVEVFHHAMKWIVQRGGRVVFLDDNFRSLPAPIAFVNALFQGIFQPGPERPFEPEPQDLRARRNEERPAPDGTVEILLTDPDETDLGEASAIADRMREMMAERREVFDPDEDRWRPVKWADIAIIVFYRRFLSALENALLARGIPFNVRGGRGFFQTREVTDVLALLTALTDPRHDIALATLLRSPFFGFSDPLLWRLSRLPGAGLADRLDQASAQPGLLHDGELDDEDRDELSLVGRAHRLIIDWGDAVGRIPTSSLIGEALDATGYRAILAALPGGARQLANLEKLIEFVRGFEERHGIRPAHLVEWLTSRSALDIDEGEASESDPDDSVHLMTIHQAKGTEYPIVIVPDLRGRGRTSDGIPVTPFHDLHTARLGLKVPSLETGGADDLVESARYRLVRLAVREREKAEQKRVLYVAMTRARDALILSARPPQRSGAGEGPLRWLLTDADLRHAIEDPDTGTVDVGHTPVSIRRRRAGDGQPIRNVLPISEVAGRLLLTPVPPAPEADIASPGASAGPSVFTVTQLADLAVSPRRFHRRHVLGLTEGTDAGGASHRQAADAGAGRPREIGQLVHRILARYRTFPAGGDASGDRSPRAGTPSGAAAGGNSDPIAGAPDAVRAHVTSFLASERGREALAAAESHTEVPFTLVSAGARLEGAIDRLYRPPDGPWTVLDAKTHRLAPGESPGVVTARHGYDVQVALYAAATRHLLELGESEAVRAVVLYTDGSGGPAREWVREYGGDELPSAAELERLLVQVADAVRDGREERFPDRPERTRADLRDLLMWSASAH